MNQLISSLILLFLLLVCFGCGSGSDSPNSNRSTAASGTPVSTPGPENSVDKKVTLTEPDATPASGAINPLVAAREKRLGEMRKQAAGQDAPKLDIEMVLRQSTRPAPENSEFSVALTDILVERRIFLKNPTLAKAEKITEGTDSTLHIFMKDGRSFKVPGEKVGSLSTASSAEILTAAGVPVPPRERTGEKPGVRKN